MSGFGGRGGGRGPGGGRGRSSGGRFSGGRGRSGGRGPSSTPAASKGKLTPCSNFTSTGTCKFGDKCNFSHSLKLHATVEASKKAQVAGNTSSFQNNYNSAPSSYAVSSIAIWESSQPFKIFSGAHDGYWRLWNPSANFGREFEHYMGPPVQPDQMEVVPPKIHAISIVNNYLFVAFDAPCQLIPGPVAVGMVHAWNLNSPSDAPMQFHLDSDSAPFAHALGVTSLRVQPDGTALTGGKDALIRCWAMDGNVFKPTQILSGHAKEVTCLARALPSDPILWSGSTDGTLRLWDTASGACPYMITCDTLDAAGQSVGHSAAITSLITWDSGNNNCFILSSSLDGSIRAWSPKAECMASAPDVSSGVVCMALHHDLSHKPLLICGLVHGDIAIRTLQQTATLPALSLIMTLNGQYLRCGHNLNSASNATAIRAVESGPQHTFYTGGEDGKMCVWQIVSEFQI